MLWGSIAAEATAALGSMSTGTSGGVNGRGCLALAFLRHFRRTSRERLAFQIFLSAQYETAPIVSGLPSIALQLRINMVFLRVAYA